MFEVESNGEDIFHMTSLFELLHGACTWESKILQTCYISSLLLCNKIRIHSYCIVWSVTDVLILKYNDHEFSPPKPLRCYRQT